MARKCDHIWKVAFIGEGDGFHATHGWSHIMFRLH
jgi:hypothetical protein